MIDRLKVGDPMKEAVMSVRRGYPPRAVRACGVLAIFGLLMALSGCDGSDSPSDGSTSSPDAKALQVVDYGFSVNTNGTQANTLSYGVTLRNKSKHYAVSRADLVIKFYDAKDQVVLDSGDLSGYGQSFVADVPPGSPTAVSGLASLAGQHRPERMTVTVPKGDSADRRVSWIRGKKMSAATWARGTGATLGPPRENGMSTVTFSLADGSAEGVQNASNIDTQLVFRDQSGDVVGGYPSVKIPSLKKEKDGWRGSFSIDLSRVPKSFSQDDITVYVKFS